MGTGSPRRCCIAIIGLAFVLTTSLTGSSRAAEPAKRAAVAPAVAPATAPAEAKVLPEINLKNMALTDVIDFLRDADPSFNAVVAYDPGTTLGEPQIQELRLKNVTAASVLKVLADSYPQIHVEANSAGGVGAIWSIRVSIDPRIGFRPGGGAPGVPGFAAPMGPEGEQQPPPPQQPVTFVHRLREIVDDMVPPNASPADRKAALESIVSLVQTTLETGEGTSPFKKADHKVDAVLKLHEGTEALIFHGTPEQAGLVSQALETLQPRQDKDNFNVRQLSAQVRRLSEQVAMLEKFIGLHGPEGGPAVPGEAGPGGTAPQTRPAQPKADGK